MKTAKILTILVLASAIMVWTAEVSEAAPLGTAFTYQGHLYDNNEVADGLYDFQFKLFDDSNDPCSGNQLGSDVNKPDVDVIDAYFRVELDFGSDVFDGNAVWLETGVRPGELNDSNAYTPLSPRQEITPVPYALQTRGIFVDNAGNVGIGTTSPSERLEVTGNSYISGSLGIGTTPVSPYTLYVFSDTASPGSRSGFFDNYSSSSTAYGLFARATRSAGSVHYGLYGTATGATTNYGVFGSAFGGATNWAGYFSGNLYAGGDVGIGITNPSTELDVAGTVKATAFVGDGSGLTNLPGLTVETDPTVLASVKDGVSWGELSAIPAGFADGVDDVGGGDSDWTISGNDMYSIPPGNVGIGDASPAAKLTVDGAILRSGSTMYGSNANTHINLGTISTTGKSLGNYSYATVSGGYDNDASGASATVCGGIGNIASGYATVGGGGYNDASGDYATVGGGYGNDADANYATVGGGFWNDASGDRSTVGGGGENVANDRYATIGGGRENSANDSYVTVGGGLSNDASGYAATIGGGWDNDADGNRATVAGGHDNGASGEWATVGGGWGNDANGGFSTVGGGWSNTASGGLSTVGGGAWNDANSAATVGGGYYNTASGEYATVSGGSYNTASGAWSTVGGGRSNVAGGGYSFAAGRRAKANHDGAFVWADSVDANFASTDNNRFAARASGGVYFYTNSTATSGVSVAAGGTSWSSISDRATKENFSPVDKLAVLEMLADLPVQEYNLKSQDESIRHIGPVAQDFATFGYGESRKAINMEDADGIAFAAIQGLYQLVQEKEAEIAAMKERMTAMEGLLAKLAGQQEGGVK